MKISKIEAGSEWKEREDEEKEERKKRKTRGSLEGKGEEQD